MAGCSGGTSGKSRTISGLISRAMMRSMPPASATFINPMNRVITPTRPMARVTAPEAASIIALDNSSMGALPPSTGIQANCRQPAKTKATLTMARSMPFIAFLCSQLPGQSR